MFIQLRSRAETHTQTERAWTSSLKRRNAVSQKLDRDTHPERSAGILDEEECRKDRQKFQMCSSNTKSERQML